MVLKDLEIQNVKPQEINIGYQHESISMESLAFTSNLKKLESQITDEFPEISNKQDTVRVYNQIQKAIDVATEANGELNAAKFDALIVKLKADFTAKHSESLEKIDAANDKAIARLNAQLARRMEVLNEVNAMGSGMNKSGGKFSSEQKMRLTKNIENEIADLNLQINMDFQKIKKLSDQHHQCMQLARGIAKTVHDMRINNAKAAGGR